MSLTHWHVLENQGELPHENDMGVPCLTIFYFILFYFSMLFILPQNTNGKNTRLSQEKMIVVRKPKKKP